MEPTTSAAYSPGKTAATGLSRPLSRGIESGRQTELSEQMQNQNIYLSDLLNTIDMLQTRLEPVLSPGLPIASTKDGSEMLTKTGMGGAISENNNRIIRATRHVNEIMSRLEL